MVAAPAAGLVEMGVLMCLGVALIFLACISTRLPRVLDKVTTSVEWNFDPSVVYNKSNRAAGPLCKHLLALVHSAVEEGEALALSSQATRSARLRTCIETPANAPTTKPKSRPEL